MKVSLNWIRFLNQKYHCAADPAPDGLDKLAEKIGAQLGAVEEVIDLGKKYEGVTVVKVVSCQKHPNADKLSVCMIDVGEAKSVQVVCGAPNVKAGMLVAWIPPGKIVPSIYDKDPFAIEAREIRDVVSNGMLASAKELALGDNHEGILEIDQPVQIGTPFAEAVGLNDYVIDIENKMFTHRPDLFGQLGIAREIAGIQHQVFKSPDWYQENASIKADGRSNGLKIEVKNEVPKLVPRFCAIVIKDVKVGPSPVWLQVRLSSVGIRPINNIVDITNLYMMETAQPLHAYDYDKVKTGVLGVRLSKKGEQLKLLGGKEIKLDEGAVVITDGHRPVGLGGIMGGADTEVDNNTKNIIVECANFEMNQIRKTAMHYGLFTDAATRFTKNQNPRQNKAVIAKAIEDIQRVAGGRIASKLVDVKNHENRGMSVKTDIKFINSRLGLGISAADIKKLLENVEFKIEVSGEKISVTAPFWRTDIHIPEDIVEEVGRLYGYDKLPVVLPKRDITPAPKDKLLAFKSRIREILKQAGANEVLTYSFVHESLLKKAGQDPKDAFHIRNAISPDLQYYRLSVTPSLLEKIHSNIRAGFDEFALFEIGKGHNKKMKDPNEPDIPMEFEMLSLVAASKDKSLKNNGSPLYQARVVLNYLAAELGIELEYRSIKQEEPYPVTKPFEHNRSAQVWEPKSKMPLGMVGEYKQSVMHNFKLPAYCAGFEIGIEQLLQVVPPHSPYHPLNRFPELEQDFCLRSSAQFSYQELTNFMMKNLELLSKDQGYSFWVKPLDIFQKENDPKHKQTTWRIILWHPERTLTTKESNKLLDELANKAKEELNAERI
ncbi:phenylalanine--tRNA ligase subunit beta [Candidatus Saccharibacteria bacterium]|nr:phenylalanine--tRNA ligase subunit beta [Candidatus Saccharibacteria bacterium]